MLGTLIAFVRDASAAVSIPTHDNEEIAMKRTLMLGLLAAAAVPPALAVEIKAGDWTVDVGGNVNAFYTLVKCEGGFDGGIALGSRTGGCGGQDRRTTVGNGLLPSALVTTVTANQGGWDVKGLIGIYVHTATDSAIAQNSEVDVRQGFFSFGRPDLGTFKLGRDFGLFGSNAIFGDMTLHGVGAPVQLTQRGRVALGHIGAGYTYLNHYGQVTYTAPKVLPYGIGVDVGLMSPVADTPIVADPRFSAKSTPQVQVQLSGTYGPVKGWFGYKTQHFEALDRTPGATFTNTRMNAVEVGASMDYNQFSFLLNFQKGKALGLLSDADQGNVKSTHYFVQGLYKVDDKLRVGLNWGESKNNDNGPGTGGLEKNTNVTLGAYYDLTKAITLVGELSQTRSSPFNGGSSHMNGIAVGGFFSF
jgi:predicted porin